MSKVTLLLACGLLPILIVVIVWWKNPPTEHLVRPRATESQAEQMQVTPAPAPQANGDAPNAYPQQSLKSQSREDAIRTYVESVRRDPQYQWKIPIRFYGKVVDQNQTPVPGANVHLQWNDLSERGTSKTTVRSNDQGLFSLSGVQGKFLGVRVDKEGYYAVHGTAGMAGFEYANPAESWFYEPDPNNPVIFHLRANGNFQPLVVQSVELKLIGQGATGTVDLPTGKVSSSRGQLRVTVWKPIITTEQINARKVFPYDWRIQIRINDGGLAEHKDILALEAPESGYVAEYNASLRPTNGASADVTLDRHFYFYFGQPRKYGRFHLKTDGDRPYVSIAYWFNPTGSRSLEYQL